MNTLKHLFMLDHWSNVHRKWEPLLLCGSRNAVIETTCVVETSSADICECVSSRTELEICPTFWTARYFPTAQAEYACMWASALFDKSLLDTSLSVSNTFLLFSVSEIKKKGYWYLHVIIWITPCTEKKGLPVKIKYVNKIQRDGTSIIYKNTGFNTRHYNKYACLAARSLLVIL